MNNGRPASVKEGLSAIPLVHLVPTQDLGHLLKPGALKVIPEEIEELSETYDTSTKQLKDAMNTEPDSYRDVINHFVNEYESFEDKELDDIQLRTPNVPVDNMVEKEQIDVDLPPFERRIYETEIAGMRNEADFRKSDIDSNRQNSPPTQMEDPFSLSLGAESKYSTLLEREIDYFLSNRKNSFPKTENFQDSTLTSSKRPANFSIAEQKERKKILPLHVINEKILRDYRVVFRYIIEEEESDLCHQYFYINNGRKLLRTTYFSFFFDTMLRLQKENLVTETDVNDLLFIQKLCLRSLSETFSGDWSEIVESQRQQLDTSTNDLIGSILNSIAAAKALMATLMCPLNDRRLHVEEYYEKIMINIHHVIQNLIIPATFSTSRDASRKISVLYEQLLNSMLELLYLISGHIAKSHMDERSLTKLEYLSLLIIFSESTTKDKRTSSEYPGFESLKLLCCDIILNIFKYHFDQRIFILNEVLSNCEKTLSQKQLGKLYKLPRGGSIHLTSALLMNLVQCFDEDKIKSEIKESEKYLDDGNKMGLNGDKKHLLGSVKSLIDGSVSTANDIVSFFLNRIPNSQDNQAKMSFDIFLNDMLSVLLFPEWSSAEILILCIWKSLIYKLNQGIESAQLETYALEVASTIGISVFKLKRASKTLHQLNENSTVEDIMFYSNCFHKCVQYCKSQRLKSFHNSNSLNYLVLKLANRLFPILSKEGKQESQLDALNSDNDHLQMLENLVTDVNALLNSLLSVFKDDMITFNDTLEPDIEKISIECYGEILISQDLPLLFDSFIKLIVKTLDNSKIKSKTRAIRCLSSLINIDSNLLISPHIQESISRKLLDPSPLVRDAVIDLIHRFMLSKPEVIDQFHGPICDRLVDDSVQVRKRVLKIAKEMYQRSTTRSVRSQIGTKILRKLHDEDDVISEMAKSYLVELWFQEIISDLKRTSAQSSKRIVFARVEVMMDIVSASGKNSTLFEQFLNECILCSTNHDTKTALTLIIDKAVDFIIDCTDMTLHKDVEKALMLLCVISKEDGKLITQDQIIALQPFIVSEENSSELTGYYSLQILRHVLSENFVLRPEFIDAVQSYILKKLTKLNLRELHEAMPCVWILSSVKNDTIKLANAAISCMKLVKPFVEQSKSQGKLDITPRLLKLLNLLGCFGRYCKLEKHRDLFFNAQFGMKVNETVTSLITKFLLFFCLSGFNQQLRKTAIKNTIHVCFSHPKLFMSDAILKVFDNEFKGSNLEIKLSIIQGFTDFLVKEDSESQKRNGVDEKSSRNLKLDVAVFHGSSQTYINDGICAGLIQRYLTQILDFCIFEAGEMSLLPVNFLRQVVNLGFSNPKVCVPYIIALESSTDSSIRHMALNMHKDMFERYESLTDTCYVDGIKLAVRFRKALSNSIFEETFFLKNLYIIASKSVSSRKKFVHALSKLFTINLNLNKLEQNTFQRDCIIYILLNTAEISFASLEEVIILIISLDKVISRQGIDLAEKLSDVHNDESIGLMQKRVLCVLCQAMIGVLTLRNYLAASYNISPIIIENFNSTKVDQEYKQAPRIVSEIPLNYETREINSVLKDPRKFSTIYAKLVQGIHDYSQ